MSLLIIGSIAIDNVKTPATEGKDLPGGSALYASLGASLFTKPEILGIVGNDFKEKWFNILTDRGIDVSSVKIANGKTFRWSGVYENFNNAITLDTQLNVFSEFEPILTKEQVDSEFVLLGNIKPELQMSVLNQLNKQALVALDTMNFWINSDREMLIEVIKKVGILFINEEEAKLLAKSKNVFLAIEKIAEYYQGLIVIKRGEYGAFLYDKGKYFFSPAFPTSKIVDTTGAGDSFAGAFMGYLSNYNYRDFKKFKKALLYGIVTASYTIESLSLFKLSKLRKRDLDIRFNLLREYIGL